MLVLCQLTRSFLDGPVSLHKDLTVTISNASSVTPLDLITIEQEEWSPYTGYLTKANMVKIVASYLYGTDFGATIDCGIADGQLVTLIYAYPKIADLDYTMRCSRGTLSERLVEFVEETEVVNFELEDIASLSHPARELISYDWYDEFKVYDKTGKEIAYPVVTIIDNEVSLSQKVYGSVEVTYQVERHTYGITVEQREESIENFYSSVVFATYEKGIKYLELTQPPNSDELNENLDASCTGGYKINGSFSSEDDDDTSSMSRNADRKIVVAYCEQEVLTDEIYAK